MLGFIIGLVVGGAGAWLIVRSYPKVVEPSVFIEQLREDISDRLDTLDALATREAAAGRAELTKVLRKLP